MVFKFENFEWMYLYKFILLTYIDVTENLIIYIDNTFRMCYYYDGLNMG